MPKGRKELIQKISAIRQSSVITYIGGDRQNISTRIAPDIIPVFYKHLKNLSSPKKLDLFLFTKGGDVHTAIRLVQLVYEFTNYFSVLIPFKAYSAGTLIALGASEIIMTRMGELSPVDPHVTSMFNPQDPRNPAARLPVNVEDVYSFFKVTKDLGIRNEAALVEVFSRLLEHVHPLALGNLYRSYSLIRSIAKRLLLTHIDSSQSERVNHVVDNLTKKLFSHSYMISRKEALESIKLPIVYASDELEDALLELYELYEKDLMLEMPFDPELGADSTGRFSVASGIIESIDRTDRYVFDGVIEKSLDPGLPCGVTIISQGWKTEGGGES